MRPCKKAWYNRRLKKHSKYNVFGRNFIAAEACKYFDLWGLHLICALRVCGNERRRQALPQPQEGYPEHLRRHDEDGSVVSVKGAQASMPMLARCWMQCSGYLQAKGMPRCCASRRLWHGCCTQPRPFDSCCVTTILDIVYPFQDQATILGAMLGQCWAAWGPCSGHVGAMCDHVTHVGLKLVHVRLLGPCQGHVGLLGLCWLYVGSWYVPVGHTFMSCAI